MSVMPMFPTAIQLIEVSPRDGLQNEPAPMSTADKVTLVHSAAGAGARRIEAVSFVNPKAVPQMADAAEVMAALNQSDLRERGVSLAGLVLNFRGFERAVASGVDEVNLVVVASETFNQRNQGAAIAQTMQAVGQAVAGAKAERLVATLTIGAAFGCPFEGEVDVSRVVDLAAQAAAMGVDEIALADTIGVGDPLAVETRLAAVRAVAGDIPLRVHFHNTRNTGLANAYAAWRMGVDRMDASIGGIGGCPFAPAATGNVPTEDMAYMFARMGVETGLDQAALSAAAIWLGEKLGPSRIPGMMSKAGPFPAKG